MTPFESLPNEKLSKESEALLAKAIQRGDAKSLERLVISSLREAVVYGRQFYAGTFSDSELMSVCYGVLASSAKRFDPSRQRFMAFCKCGIRGAIKRYWQTFDPVRNASVKRRKDGYDTHLPTFMDFDYLRLHGKESEKTEVGDPEFESEPLGTQDPDWSGIHARERSSKVWAQIKKILTEREEMILFLKYDLGFNYVEIGSLLGISATLALYEHRDALAKLRQNLEPLKQLITEQ